MLLYKNTTIQGGRQHSIIYSVDHHTLNKSILINFKLVTNFFEAQTKNTVKFKFE